MARKVEIEFGARTIQSCQRIFEERERQAERNDTSVKKVNKFALLVFAIELCASIESLSKRNNKMAGVWLLYSLSNLILAFVSE